MKLAPGGFIAWSGQFEYLERARGRLAVALPFTLLIVFWLLYLAFRRSDEATLIMTPLPFSVVGGPWYLYLLGHPRHALRPGCGVQDREFRERAFAHGG